MPEFLSTAVSYVLPFLAVLTIVVTVHEFGHFLAARACGVAVDRFSIGFGRAVAKWTDRKGVEWRLGWLPLGGYGTLGHLVLPALTLGILGAGWYARMMRGSLLEVLRQDYIRTARAKGASRARVVLVHGLRNAILPIVAMIGLDIGLFMSGAVVVETVYGWPGIGQLAWQAIQRVDIPIIVGVTTVAAFFIVLGNLVADLVAPLIDPRIRLR